MSSFLNKYYELFLVFVITIISRLPALGYDIFNTDVWKWKARSYDFGSGIFNFDFALTLQKYHPGVTLLWLNTLAIKIFNYGYVLFNGISPPDNSVDTIFGLHFVQKVTIVFAIAVVLGLFYYALRELFGRSFAVIATTLILVEPFYIALTRVIHLEGLMSTFMIASFVWFFYGLENIKNKKRLIISGFFTGLAILTKTSALFLLPLFGILLVFHFGLGKNSILIPIKSALKEYGIWLLTVILTFVLLWPAFYTIPSEVISVLYRGIFTIGVERGHEQLYFGELVGDPGFFFYPVVFLYKTSIFLIPGLIGLFVLSYKRLDKKAKKFINYSLLFSLLYLVELTIPSKKLDRYLLPCILSLSLITAFFYQDVVSRFKQYGKVFLISALLLWSIYLSKIHPDYFSYYNPIFGDLKVGIQILEPKWVIGHHALFEKLLEIKDAEGYDTFYEGENVSSTKRKNNKFIVALPEKYYTQVWPFIRHIGGWAVIEDLRGDAEKAKLFVYPVWDYEDVYTGKFTLIYLDTVKLRGVPIYYIYKNVTKI